MTGKLYKAIFLMLISLMVTAQAQVNNTGNSETLEREKQDQEDINPTGQVEDQAVKSQGVVQSQSGQAGAEKQNNLSTPDTFTPSEEISEDLSVSFPVDI